MVLPYMIDAVLGLVEILAVESGAGLGVTLGAVLTDPAYRRGFGFLRHRRAAGPPVPRFLDDTLALVSRTPDLVGTRWALVSEDVRDGSAACRAAALAHGIDMGIFETRDAAVHWLTGGRATAR